MDHFFGCWSAFRWTLPCLRILWLVLCGLRVTSKENKLLLYLWIHWPEERWRPSRLYAANTKGFWSRRQVWIGYPVSYFVRHRWRTLPVESGTFFNLRQQKKRSSEIRLSDSTPSTYLEPVQPFLHLRFLFTQPSDHQLMLKQELLLLPEDFHIGKKEHFSTKKATKYIVQLINTIYWAGREKRYSDLLLHSKNSLRNGSIWFLVFSR